VAFVVDFGFALVFALAFVAGALFRFAAIVSSN
jgi:hypothetical protein